jgi:hypothetical protein
MPWISAQLAAGSVVRFARHADLPPEAAADLPRLRALDIRSAVIVPLAASGSVVGALSFATARDDHDWRDELIPRVKLVGEVFEVLARCGGAPGAGGTGADGVAARVAPWVSSPPARARADPAAFASPPTPRRSSSCRRRRPTSTSCARRLPTRADDRRAGELIQQLPLPAPRQVERTALDLREVVDEACASPERSGGKGRRGRHRHSEPAAGGRSSPDPAGCSTCC